MGRSPVRQGSAAGEEQVLALVREHAGDLLRWARRFSLCADDAQDAYQRTLEKLVRRMRAEPPDNAVRWAQTVVRHEALAIRAEREQTLGRLALEDDRHRDAGALDPAERVERFERLAHTAEALRGLKPQEMTALALRAEGAVVQGDLRAYGVVVHEMQPRGQRGTAGAAAAAAGDRVGGGVRALAAAAVAAGRRRGDRERAGGAASAPALVRGLPGDAARLPRCARAGRGAAAGGGAAGSRRGRWSGRREPRHRPAPGGGAAELDRAHEHGGPAPPRRDRRGPEHEVRRGRRVDRRGGGRRGGDRTGRDGWSRGRRRRRAARAGGVSRRPVPDRRRDPDLRVAARRAPPAGGPADPAAGAGADAGGTAAGGTPSTIGAPAGAPFAEFALEPLAASSGALTAGSGATTSTAGFGAGAGVRPGSGARAGGAAAGTTGTASAVFGATTASSKAGGSSVAAGAADDTGAAGSSGAAGTPPDSDNRSKKRSAPTGPQPDAGTGATTAPSSSPEFSAATAPPPPAPPAAAPPSPPSQPRRPKRRPGVRRPMTTPERGRTMPKQLTLALTALLTLLLLATPAQAGTYTVYSCKTPSGRWVGSEGWVRSMATPAQGVDRGAAVLCPASDQSLQLRFGDTQFPVENGTAVELSFAAPLATSIESATVYRSFEVDWPVLAGTYERPYIYDAWHDDEEWERHISGMGVRVLTTPRTSCSARRAKDGAQSGFD